MQPQYSKNSLDNILLLYYNTTSPYYPVVPAILLALPAVVI